MPVDIYVNTGQSAGTEVSSGGEGRVLTFEESVLTHPYHSDGFVDGKDPVFVGDQVGVALKGAAAATDMIAIDTEGIFWLNVLGIVSDGTADGLAQALVPGQRVYIQIVPGTDTYILTGESDPEHFQPFGITMSTVTSSLTVPTLVAVKVHQERNDWKHILLGAFDDELLLDPTPALREGCWLKGFIGPSLVLNAGEQIQAINFRMNTKHDGDVGKMQCAEFKCHHDMAGRLQDMLPLKGTIDSGGGGADMAACCELIAAGAGTAHSVLTGIRFKQDGTDGTLMSAMRFDTVDSFGILGVTTNPSDTGVCYQIPVDIAGTLFYLLAYNQTGTA